MTPQTSKDQAGFTLLEMVIVLGIVSSLLGAFFSFYQPTQIAQSNASTRLKLERIQNALSSYALRSNRLPCPALTNATTSTFGTAPASCSGTGSAIWGLVPFIELGLAQEDVKDGFGRYITYIVAQSMTLTPANSIDATDGPITAGYRSPTRLGSSFCQDTAGLAALNLLKIQRDGSPLPPAETNVVFALVAYGSDGYGAYSMDLAALSNRFQPIGSEGGNNIPALDALLGSVSHERDNSVDKAAPTANTIYISNYSEQKNTSHFDDQVSYTTGSSLISRLGVAGCTS